MARKLHRPAVCQSRSVVACGYPPGVVLLAAVIAPAWLSAQAPVPARITDDPQAGSARKGSVALPAEISVKIESIDIAQRTLQFRHRNEILSRSLTLGTSVRVILDDGTGDRFGFQDGKLADVTKGQTVTLRLSADRKEIVGIWVEGPTVEGILKNPDAENHSIPLLVRRDVFKPRQEETFPVTETTKIATRSHADEAEEPDKLPSRPCRLANLTVGAICFVKLSAVDQKTAGVIHAAGPTAAAFFKSFDAAENTLTVRTYDGLPERTYELAKNLRVTMYGTGYLQTYGTPVKLADVPLDTFVQVSLSADLRIAEHVCVQVEEVHGTVKSVDVEHRRIQITSRSVLEDDYDCTLAVPKDIVIEIDGERGTLADVPVKATVHAEPSLDGKMARSLRVNTGRRVFKKA